MGRARTCMHVRVCAGRSLRPWRRSAARQETTTQGRKACEARVGCAIHGVQQRQCEGGKICCVATCTSSSSRSRPWRPKPGTRETMAMRTTETREGDGEDRSFTVGVLLESYEVDGGWRRWEDALIVGGARHREVEEDDEDDVEELGGFGLGSQRNGVAAASRRPERKEGHQRGKLLRRRASARLGHGNG